MKVPRTSQPRICSLRSSDLQADPGVLPPGDEQRALHMLVVEVPVKHDGMWDGASVIQKQRMVEVVSACIESIEHKS
jgi:hypothetical protein